MIVDYNYRQFRGSVAYVEVEGTDGTRGIGSAFHVGDGVFATARHVIEGKVIRQVATVQPHRWPLHVDMNRGIDEWGELGPFGGLPERTLLPDDDSDVALLHVPEAKALPFLPMPPPSVKAFDGFVLQAATVMGFPRVPLSRDPPVLVALNAEINAVIQKYTDGHDYLIVSSMARGGFSGAGDASGVSTDADRARHRVSRRASRSARARLHGRLVGRATSKVHGVARFHPTPMRPTIMRKELKGDAFTEAHSAGLRLLLTKWRELAADPIWKSGDEAQDCSWWYGERASVSQLAGAAWALRGWAMTDYAWMRRKKPGGPATYAQIDLCVERRNGPRFIAEAKQVWPEIDRPRTLKPLIEGAFAQLRRELDGIDPDCWDRMMFVFVAPWWKPKRSADAMNQSTIATFIESLKGRKGAAVWTFPTWARQCVHKASRHDIYYPGVALIARKIDPTR